MTLRTILIATALVPAVGCISVKTENEIKPIHITMDVNLKVDKELEKSFANENMSKPRGDFAEIKKLLDDQRAGVNQKGLLEPRSGATDDDRILIAEANARKTRRYAEIAKDSGVSVEAVQKRSARRFQEKIPAGSGVWIQNEDGRWIQK